MKYLKPTIYYK